MFDKNYWDKEIHQDKSKQNIVHWFILISVLIFFATLISVKIGDVNSDNYGIANVIGSKSVNMSEMNNQLIRELSAYSRSNNQDKESRISAIRQVLITRKSEIDRRVNANNIDINSYLLPNEIVSRLPSELQNLVEQDFDSEGLLFSVFIDGINDENSKLVYHLEVSEDDNTKIYKVNYEKGSEPYLRNKVKTKIKGKVLSDNIFVLNDGKQTTNTSNGNTTTALADVSGPKRLLVIPINFTDNASQPYTSSYIYNTLFTNSDSTNSLIKEGSFNELSLAGDVTNWVTVGSTLGTCDNFTWANQANQLVAGLGYSTTNYDYIMYFLNGVSACNWGGQAIVGGNQSWINGIYASHGSKAHELGHNFGAWHSGYTTCGTQQISSTCTLNQYGEIIAKMGSTNNFQFNVIHKNLFGWIPSTQVQTVSSGGTYTISSDYSSSTINPKIIKIAKPDTSENYYIGFRQPLGFNSNLPAGSTKGATIYKWRGTSHTEMLTMTPGSDYSNTALWDNGVFNDISNGISVTQLSHTNDTVTLSINFNSPPCVPSKPVVSVSPLSQQGSAGSTLNYNVSITNKNNLSCGSSTFTVYPILSNGFSSSNKSLTLGSGITGNTSISISSALGIVDGNYPFTIKVIDNNNAGNEASVSANYIIFTPLPDTESPTVTITSPANNSVISGTQTTISISATDNVNVSKVELTIDNKLVATLNTKPFSYKWNTRKVSSGVHTISAKAYDPSGNSSSTSIIVTK